MANKPRKAIRFGQNFLKSPRLVHGLVEASSIGPTDTVYEIGPGRGIITAELARAAKKVIAIEKDRQLVRHLRERFRGRENVEIVEADFLDYSFRTRANGSRGNDAPSLTVGLQTRTSDFKIFASIPYNITASVVRKILNGGAVPQEAYLVLQKEPARKFSGYPRESEFSILAKPFFEFQIIRELRRTDFEPVPDVDSVLLRIKRRRAALIKKEEGELYRDFVRYGFGSWKRHLRSAFKHVFTYKQWKRLSRDLHFSLDATPTQLSFDQWLGLYRGFREFALRTCDSSNCRSSGPSRSRTR